jgi:hypothetical protein
VFVNEALQKELLSFIQGSKEFIISQAPEAVQQWLSIQKLEAALGIYTAIALIIICLIFWFVVYFLDIDMEESFFLQVIIVFSAVAFIFCLISLPCNYSTYYNVTKHPKGYILQKLKSN